jgi:Tfp pilus assembly protein PilO
MAKAAPSRLMFIFIFSASSIAVITALYLFAGRPSLRYAADMRARFLSYQERLQQAEELVRSLPNPQKSLEDIERKHAQFKEVSGSGKQLPKIIQALGQSVVGRQINVISIRPKEDMQAGVESMPAGVKKIFFEMIFRASYQDIGEYAKVLSSLPGVFIIENMSIDRQERDASSPANRSGLLTANFIISTYMVGDL